MAGRVDGRLWFVGGGVLAPAAVLAAADAGAPAATSVALIAGGVLAIALMAAAPSIVRIVRAARQTREPRMHLELIVERHPDPMLRLGRSGDLQYANPAAGWMAAAVFGDRDAVRRLLPDDLDMRLDAVRAVAPHQATWEYAVGARRVECQIQWLPDLDCFHVALRDVSEHQRAAEQLVHQAFHDPLTGLPNRRMFEEHLEHRLYAERRGGMRAAYLLLGVDRFRVIIESYGPTAGDVLLQALAERLRDLLQQEQELAPEAALYRMDGDRFAVFVPGFATSQAPMRLAEHLLAGLRAPFYALGREYHLSLSIGISVYPLDGQDAPTLERNAETAMQHVKQQGGASFECYTREMNEQAAEWLALENQLRHAEPLDELELYYQPQVELHSGRIVGVEALIRWRHPSRGLLAPAQFLALAEESGLIVPIGDWVLRRACAQAAAWRREGFDRLTVAVNLSARQFAQPELPQRVAELLRQSEVPAERFEIEITENVAMRDVARAISALQELKHIGVQLSVDDFGTGFSSLNYLKRFPIDRLKIDQSFVRHLPHDEDDAAITRAVLALGNSLRLRVIAEGVETAEQLAWLGGSGCHEYQGYYFSAPLPARDVSSLLQAQTAGSGRAGAAPGAS